MKVVGNKIFLNQKMTTTYFPSSMLNRLLYLITFRVIKTSIIILFQVTRKNKDLNLGLLDARICALFPALLSNIYHAYNQKKDI